MGQHRAVDHRAPRLLRRVVRVRRLAHEQRQVRGESSLAQTKTKAVREKAGHNPVTSGKRFGRLVAQWPAGIAGTNVSWLCLCDCGKFKSVRACNLSNGSSTSCRCFTADRIGHANITHGFLKGRKLGKLPPQSEMWSKAAKIGRASCRERVYI